ncbi:hypothetical protein Lal_00026416 [Lupinus albus]|nr:hypothetical protein Lal_00026416 [Lupinus albus]
MAEESPASETSVTMPQPVEAVTVDGTLTESGISVETNSDFISNNNNAAEASAPASLELADELMDKGDKAMKIDDYGDAADNFSRALEIRVARYGELAPECVNTYYKYGCALLYKAQEEADPLAGVPKKESGSQHGSNKDESVKSSLNADSSSTSVSTNAGQDMTSDDQGAASDDCECFCSMATGKGQEEDDEDSDADDLAEADEDDSDLDLAWKMLDVARAIVEKHSGNTMEHVDILSTLADVSLEREDFDTSLSDYQKALSILERLTSLTHEFRNFRICLCLEVGSKPEEAITYCQKSISACKAQLQRLKNEVKSFSDSTSAAAELDQDIQTYNISESGKSIADKQAEIETLTGLASELEKKLEDLQQQVLNPKSILAELLGIASAKASSGKESSVGKVGSSQLATANNSGGFDSATISTAGSNGSAGVTHLGVVGRGVKRASNASGAETSTPKKPALESTEDKGDGKTS